jgi:NAD(P)-dependent dehydrogenase (short-subunit alcohol dehydrogenase family)
MAYNIHVVTLCPGSINTSWWDRDDYIWGNRDEIIRPSQVARVVEFILSQDSNTLFKQVTFLPVNEIEDILGEPAILNAIVTFVPGHA